MVSRVIAGGESNREYNFFFFVVERKSILIVGKVGAYFLGLIQDPDLLIC